MKEKNKYNKCYNSDLKPGAHQQIFYDDKYIYIIANKCYYYFFYFQ